MQGLPDDEVEYHTGNVSDIRSADFHNFIDDIFNTIEESTQLTMHHVSSPTLSCYESKVSINKVQVSKVFNFIKPQTYSIMDNGADTSVIEQGWYILGVDKFRKMNINGFDSQASRKMVLEW